MNPAGSLCPAACAEKVQGAPRRPVPWVRNSVVIPFTKSAEFSVCRVAMARTELLFLTHSAVIVRELLSTPLREAVPGWCCALKLGLSSPGDKIRAPLYALGITSSVKKTSLSLQTSFVFVLGASN